MMNKTPVAIVTGASRGLGAAVACWLGKVGAAVTLVARSVEKLGETGDEVRRLGGEPLVCRADVSQYDACRKAVDKTLARFCLLYTSDAADESSRVWFSGVAGSL